MPRDREAAFDVYAPATTSVVIARLDRATQYSRDSSD
jgi:hypothetical protein